MEIGNTLESAAKIVSEMGQEFTNTFEVLGNIKEGFQDVLKHNLEDGLIQNLCYSVLCGGFMLLKCCHANLKKTIQEMEKEELPKRLHPYIRESKPRKYKLTAEEKFELKMLMRNFKRDLKTTEDKYKDADRALKSLQSELETYLTKEGVLAAGASALIGAGVGAACGVALIVGASVVSLCPLFFSLKGWFDKRELYSKLSLIIRNYSEMANECQNIF
ncbi:unnamed protein product [Porites evermanni]|uniref:Uncharacterized protein n=1 Tax=Porites evermanni TaxID=104178 RepID=A0ABN8PF34_9CNID|nr:unnamed protein product [Porites evermanni]